MHHGRRRGRLGMRADPVGRQQEPRPFAHHAGAEREQREGVQPYIAPVRIRFGPRYPVADLGVQRFLFLGCKHAIIRDRSDRPADFAADRPYRRDRVRVR